MSADISVVINGRPFSFPKDHTILMACNEVGIYIPTLCHHPDLPDSGKCGLCVVKVNGNSFALSCIHHISSNMSIETASPDVLIKARKAFANFMNMSVIPPSNDIEDVCAYLNPKVSIRNRDADHSRSVKFNPKECINCDRCVRMCSDVQNIGALNELHPNLMANECISCGLCITVCPTRALEEVSALSGIFKANAQRKILIMQIAPAVRVSIGELFDEEPGTMVTGKIISAAKKMGFQYVLDTNFGADVTVMEEGHEFLKRLENNIRLPQFTSCCPAWVNFVEKLHPELIPNLSTTKSPHMIVGALVKTYFADLHDIDPKDIYLVSLMPCVAKKDEIKRMQLLDKVDAVITAREFGQLIETYGISWSSLKNMPFDKYMGKSSGGGKIFGVSGGVAESSLRYLYQEMTHQPLGKLEFKQLRGMNAIREAKIKIGDKEIKVAVCNGISAAREFIEGDRYKSFHFVEVMACPGGCVFGGGQPKIISRQRAQDRVSTIRNSDEVKEVKVCSDNPQVVELYKSFLGSPGGPKSRRYLHTHFEPHETAVLVMKKQMETRPIVAFGSSSGTSMRLARVVANFMGTISIPINSLKINTLSRHGLIIFILSTVGDGEFPINAKHFVSVLQDSMEPLDNVRFAVLGLGSKSFRLFCTAGKTLNEMMEQHLAKPVIPFTPIDTHVADHGESDFEKWSHRLCAALRLKTPTIGIHLVYSLMPIEDDSITNNMIRPVSFEIASIKSVVKLTDETFPIDTRLYRIKLPKGMSYNVGEYLAILPQNPPELVDSVLDVLKLDPNQVYRVILNDNTIESYVTERLTVKQLFSQYFDLNGPPNRSLMRAFLEVAKEEGRKKINGLLDIVNTEALDEYMRDINAAEFIIEFSQYGVPPINILMSSCPFISPRLYSIASSSAENTSIVDIIVSTVKFGVNDKRKGLCTNYLATPNLTEIAIRMEPGAAEPPEDRTAPLILVALGRAAATILGLIRNRNETDGPILVIYGAKSPRAYANLVEIFNGLQKTGLITDLLFAWSRNEDGEKKHIQDVMKENKKMLGKYWNNDKTCFYYSGHPGSIPDELKEIMLTVTISEQGLSMEEAMTYNNRHPFIVEAY